VALVTDAMAAAGVPDGAYHLGALDVTVAGSTARLTGSAALAGSTTTMDAVFRRTVTASPEPRDRALLAAAAMASTTPARTLRLDDVGALAPTLRADAVVLDGNLQVVAVLRRGRWVAGVHPPGTPSATADARAGR
jgi:N-acetylglucosamine-6-phosphate deacetylase